MKRTDYIGMVLEGLFLGIAFVIAYLVFTDRRTKEPWTRKEVALFGIAMGLALGGFWIETGLGG